MRCDKWISSARSREKVLLCPLRKDLTRHKVNLSRYHEILIFNFTNQSPKNTNVSIDVMSWD